MVTIHKIMSQALTPDEYERWRQNTKPSSIHAILEACKEDGVIVQSVAPGRILLYGFGFNGSNEGYKYWEDIESRLCT